MNWLYNSKDLESSNNNIDKNYNVMPLTTAYYDLIYVKNISSDCLLLAHLSQRLVGELLVYPWLGIRPSVVVVRRLSSIVRRRPHFQT